MPAGLAFFILFASIWVFHVEGHLVEECMFYAFVGVIVDAQVTSLVVTQRVLVTTKRYNLLRWFCATCLITHAMSCDSTRGAGHFLAIVNDEAGCITYFLFASDGWVEWLHVDVSVSRSILRKLTIVVSDVAIPDR